MYFVCIVLSDVLQIDEGRIGDTMLFVACGGHMMRIDRSRGSGSRIL